MFADRRRSLRLAQRNAHSQTEVKLDAKRKGINVQEEGTKKRQRRLTTTHTQANNDDAQKVAANVRKPIAVAQKIEPRNEIELDDARPAHIPDLPPRPFANNNNNDDESSGEEFSSDESNFMPSDELDVRLQRRYVYITSGPSAKVAPGKRIKWRNAIREEDSVRQNLSATFCQLR
jgi:hypothetical protein